MLNQAGNCYKYEYSFFALGDAYKALGETQKAEEQYQLAASMVPHHSLAIEEIREEMR